jgi:tartrate dehydrogenase/decarboxylase/D-malate dehydrogenase
VIPGDGIGREVMPEGVRVLEAVGAKHGLRFEWQEFPWSCDWYKAHGKMCPDDAPQILRKFDAIYFGAVGNPAIVADHISAWGLLINFRRWFDLYVNLRPVRGGDARADASHHARRAREMGDDPRRAVRT